MNFRLRMPSQEIPRYLLRHLKGHQRVGFYNFLPDGTCFWSVAEFDKDDLYTNLDKATKFKNSLSEAGIRAYLEKSYTDRGYRVWIFFNRPVDATSIRKFMDMVLKKSGTLGKAKIYPTEESKKGEEGVLGDYIWLPFYGGIEDQVGKGTKHEHNIFVDDGAKVIPVDMSLKLIIANEPKMLSDIINSMTADFKEPLIEKKEVPEKKVSPPVEKEVKKKHDRRTSEFEPELEIQMLDNVIDNLFLWLTSETFSPLSTGFKSLDSALNGGLQAGKLMEITGGSAVERVNFCFQILDQIACGNADRELPVVALYVSRRFSKEELVLKSLCRIGEFDENFLEGRKWKKEANPDEFIDGFKSTIKLYHDVAKWIMILRMEYKVKLHLIKYALRQLSYNYNTPYVILVIEDPLLVIENSSEENRLNTMIELHMLAQQMTVPVIVLNDTGAREDIALNSLDGIIHMSFQLNSDKKSIERLLKNKDGPTAKKFDKIKEDLREGEYPFILRVVKEKTGIKILLPFINRRVYNQFLEL